MHQLQAFCLAEHQIIHYSFSGHMFLELEEEDYIINPVPVIIQFK